MKWKPEILGHSIEFKSRVYVLSLHISHDDIAISPTRCVSLTKRLFWKHNESLTSCGNSAVWSVHWVIFFKVKKNHWFVKKRLPWFHSHFLPDMLLRWFIYCDARGFGCSFWWQCKVCFKEGTFYRVPEALINQAVIQHSVHLQKGETSTLEVVMNVYEHEVCSLLITWLW